MKQFIAILSFFSLLSFTIITVQNTLDKVADGFKNGDVATLSSYFNEEVEFILLTSSKRVKKEELKTELSSFFQTYKPNGFTVDHKGEKSDNCFLIGTLTSGKDKFRIHILLRKENNDFLIYQIRITSDE